MRISTNELIIVLAIVLLIFGPKQIPKLAKMFGKATKSFKDGVAENEDEDGDEVAKEKKAAKKTEDDGE